MKVVLFCGGQGMRIREYSQSVPKPMVPIGTRPILWHLMKYYAHHGHKEFILCLGWQANVIKEYFLNYNEWLSNDFVMTGADNHVHPLHKDIDDWKITFVDTGVSSNIGERLAAVQPHLEGEETFLANYADGLTDAPLDEMIDYHKHHGGEATFMAVRPRQSFHTVNIGDNGCVDGLSAATDADLWINGGFMVLNQSVFKYMQDGEELVEQPFARMMADNKLFCYRYEGFFGCMDTLKEQQAFDQMLRSGDTPWHVWRGNEAAPSFDSADVMEDFIEQINDLAREARSHASTGKPHAKQPTATA